MDWDDLRVFRAVAQAQTLTAAARHLGASVATVARRDRRAGGHPGVSPARPLAGRRHAHHPGTRHLRARRRPPGRNGRRRAPRRLTASQRLARPDPHLGKRADHQRDLAPALPARSCARHRDIRSRSVVHDRGGEPRCARGRRCALRFAKPVGDSLIVRNLPPFDLRALRREVVLAGRRPASLDLRRERLLGFDASYRPDRRGRVDGGVRTCRCGRGAELEHAGAHRTARAGAGVALLPRLLARPVATLVEIPRPPRSQKRPAWLVTHRDLRHARPLQVVREWIVGALADRDRDACP